MFKNLLRCFVFLFSTSLFTSVNAIEVEMLHQADVPVESRAKAERERALINALKLVFIKNSGNAQVLQHELVKTSYVSPHRFLNQFRYIERDEQLVLRAIFDHKRVLSTLRKAQLPIWGNQRPLTLLWVASNEEQQRAIISDASISPERVLFGEISEQKAIPTLFPLLDLDDLMKVNVSDVRGKFIDVVGQASNRYQTDFFAIAALEQTTEGVGYQLDLYPYGSVESYVPPLLHLEGAGLDSRVAINEMVVGLSDYYANRYSISASAEQNSTQVAFAEINDMKKLVEIEAYLSSLSAVKSLQLSHVHGDTVTFNVALFGTEKDLLSLLKLESKISVLSSSLRSKPLTVEKQQSVVSDGAEDKNSSKVDLPVVRTSNVFLWRNKG